MSTLFASPIDSAYRRAITRSRTSSGGHNGGPFDAAMDSVAALLADRRARLSSPRAVNVLRKQISLSERTVSRTDARSSLIETWVALLAVAEAAERDQKIAQQRLVVVVAEMLCNPLKMPHNQRQCYWELLKAYLLMLGRNEDALTLIDPRFPQWMDALHAAVLHGRIQPVTAPWGNGGCDRRLGAAAELDRGRHVSSSRSRVTYDESAILRKFLGPLEAAYLPPVVISCTKSFAPPSSRRGLFV